MINGLSNFEVLKQKISALPKDDFLKGRQPRVGEILIVDDEEGFVLSLADGLSAYRKYFNLRTAPNGAEAVKILKLSPIDLVITDLSMPKMDGFELLAYMNRNYPKIPVILMTAYGTPKIEEIVSNMGIFRYLEKPLDINEIADNIFDALGIKTSPLESKTQASGQRQRTEMQSASSSPFAERTSGSVTDMQTKIAIAKKVPEEEKSKAQLEDLSTAEMTDKSKSSVTFGARTSLSVAELEKMREEARMKLEGKAKDDAGKKSFEDAEKKALETAEKRAILEAKARTEAERFAREEAQSKAKEAEERARQEALAREDAERRAKTATKTKAAEAEEKARQKELEEKIKQMEEYRALFDSANDAIIVMDRNLVIDCNKRALEMFRCTSKEQIIGHMTSEFWPERQRDGSLTLEIFTEPIKAVLHGEKMSREGTLKCLDGTLIDTDIVLSVVELKGKKCLQAVIRDITGKKAKESQAKDKNINASESTKQKLSAQKELEEKIKQMEEYRALFDSANDCIIVMDRNLIVDCNKRALEIFRCTSKEQIIGHMTTEFWPERQRDGQLTLEVFNEPIKAVLRGEKMAREGTLKRLDGTLIDTDIVLSVVELKGKKCLQAVIRDITGKKAKESQAKDKNINASESTKQKLNAWRKI